MQVMRFDELFQQSNSQLKAEAHKHLNDHGKRSLRQRVANPAFVDFDQVFLMSGIWARESINAGVRLEASQMMDATHVPVDMSINVNGRFNGESHVTAVAFSLNDKNEAVPALEVDGSWRSFDVFDLTDILRNCRKGNQATLHEASAEAFDKFADYFCRKLEESV